MELENGKSIVAPDPEKWHLIRNGLKMYLTGNFSALEIADIFYEKGLKSKTNKKVCNSIMINTLKNSFYAGIMKWNNQEKLGNHKPMITLDEHKQILGIMNAHNQHACRRRKHNFLLRGFVFCGICGQRYTAEKHRIGKNPDYYHCSVRNKNHSNQGQNIEVKELEKQVEEYFKKIQFSKEFINLVIQKVKKFYEERKVEKEKEKRILLNKKMEIERKREIAEEKLIAGTIVDEDFVRMRDRFKIDLTAIQSQIDEIETKRDIDTDTIREVLILARNIYEAYKKHLTKLRECI
jgi:transcription elongation factor Elf1